MTHDRNRDLLYAEAVESVEAGADPAAARAVLDALPDVTTPQDLVRAFSALQSLPVRPDFPYGEPSDLITIQAASPGPPERTQPVPDLEGRLHAAWSGRIIGCVMGKPFEDLDSPAITAYLQRHHAYPLAGYAPSPRTRSDAALLHESWPPCVADSLSFAPRDDDLDYAVLNLYLAEAHGPDVPPSHIGRFWLHHMVYGLTYTAERQSYRNLVDGFSPPTTARSFNPYREWIGAQIRADVWGYLSPGDPWTAASRAWRDACLTHTGNGLYGAMFVAALLAAVLGGAGLVEAVRAAVMCIPASSRYADMVAALLSWHTLGDDFAAMQGRIVRRWGSYHPVHSINNAALLVAALLTSGDYIDALPKVITAGWDTDSNGATAGSIMGALLGLDGLPPSLLSPLHDTLFTAVRGPNPLSISDLAARTYALIPD